jgi:sarcosine oxidase subunit beta
MNQTFDAIVIGAGAIGASIGFHLAERGLKVVILERDVIAAGATGRSSGLVRMHYDLEAESRLAWASFQYFRNWKERMGGECGFTRTGFLHIVAPRLNEHLKANVAMHQRIGIISEVVTPGDVKQIAPSFRTDDFEFAAYEPESGYADPVLTASGFVNAAKEKSALLVQGCAVTGIRVNGGKVNGVETGKGAFDAPLVINAAGTFAGHVGRLAGVEIPLDTWTHDVAFVNRPDSILPHPTVIDDSLSMYFRPDAGALTLVALEDLNRIGEAPESDVGYVAKDFVEHAIERICQRIPGMEGGSLHSTHAGRDGLTPDQRAIMDGVGPDGFYVACGFSGTGFKLSPAVGACMSELILDGQSKTVDISQFTLKRFASGELLKGEHDYGHIWK